MPDDDAERIGQVIDVAFNQGVNPRRGFELILEHYGTCSAITALEQFPPGDAATQVACVECLIRHLHAQLVVCLRAELERARTCLAGRGDVPDELIAGRDWLFADEAYHTDVSHLAAVVRYSIMVADPAALALAVDLTEYGRRLSPRLQFEGAPPFEQTFDDHRILLRALLGQDVDAAVSHFRQKVEAVAERRPRIVATSPGAGDLALPRGETRRGDRGGRAAAGSPACADADLSGPRRTLPAERPHGPPGRGCPPARRPGLLPGRPAPGHGHVIRRQQA